MAKSVKNQRVEVGVRELKSKLSHYIDLVQHGSEVIVTEHGKPVVKLVSARCVASTTTTAHRCGSCKAHHLMQLDHDPSR